MPRHGRDRLQHFYNGDFVSVIVPSLPRHPRALLLTSVSGIGLVITAGRLSLGKEPGRRPYSSDPFSWRCSSFCTYRSRPRQTLSLGAWTSRSRSLPFQGRVRGRRVPSGEERPGLNRRFTSFGCFALAITCAVFGVDHFLYVDFVASLVPAWIPHHVFWAHFCGAALIAAGMG